jgi:hypothetical protein
LANLTVSSPANVTCAACKTCIETHCGCSTSSTISDWQTCFKACSDTVRTVTCAVTCGAY